jgi:hypothetical protein
MQLLFCLFPGSRLERSLKKRSDIRHLCSALGNLVKLLVSREVQYIRDDLSLDAYSLFGLPLSEPLSGKPL